MRENELRRNPNGGTGDDRNVGKLCYFLERRVEALFNKNGKLWRREEIR